MKVYAVIYGNYYPREVEYLYMTEDLALRKRKELGGDYRVSEMDVLEQYVPEPKPAIDNDD